MQAERIIEKAQKLGINIADGNSLEVLEDIASQLGLDPASDASTIENVLDSQLNGGNNSGNTNDGIETLDAPSDMTPDSIPDTGRGRFGEAEYNAAKTEDGVYDKDHYKKKSEELDEKVKKAEEEKKKTQKEVPNKKNGGEAGNDFRNKNFFDKAKDNAELLKAKNDRLQNKINGAKAKAYNAMHPVEALKDQAKAKAKEAAKEAGKKVAKAAGEATKKASAAVGKKIAAFIASNPVVLIVIGAVALILLIIILYIGYEDSEYNYIGLSGYKYYPGACTKVLADGEFVSIEEYVKGVIAKEVGGGHLETYKTFAVAARTFIIRQGVKVGDDVESCYYDAEKVLQAYDPSRITDLHSQAVDETRGLIVTLNGEPKTYYDASCVFTKEQAEQAKPDGSYSEDYYYIKYGSLILDDYQFQPVEKDKISGIGTLEHYANEAENGGPCPGNHGYGMSQNGSNYLEIYNEYTWDQIIDYYYQGHHEIKSIYRSFSYSGKYPIEPDNELYSNLAFLIDESLENHLEKKGSTTDEFNQHLYSEIEKAGIGTREGVISAAVTLIGSLAETGVKLNYQWAGKYYSLGINPSWGKLNGSLGYCDSYNATYTSGKCETHYKWNSFDCSGFVNWAIRNGMQDNSIPQHNTTTANGTSLSKDIAVCKPGGVLVSEGHIVLIVGIDEEKNKYIVAESTGSDIYTGIGGVKLSYYDFAKQGYVCKNLDDVYGE